MTQRATSDVVLPDAPDLPTTPREMASVQAIKLLRQLQFMQDAPQGSILWNDIEIIGAALISIAREGRA